MDKDKPTVTIKNKNNWEKNSLCAFTDTLESKFTHITDAKQIL